MKKVQYKLASISFSGLSSRSVEYSQVREELDKLGKEGWELVWVIGNGIGVFVRGK